MEQFNHSSTLMNFSFLIVVSHVLLTLIVFDRITNERNSFTEPVQQRLVMINDQD